MSSSVPQSLYIWCSASAIIRACAERFRRCYHAIATTDDDVDVDVCIADVYESTDCLINKLKADQRELERELSRINSYIVRFGTLRREFEYVAGRRSATGTKLGPNTEHSLRLSHASERLTILGNMMVEATSQIDRLMANEECLGFIEPWFTREPEFLRNPSSSKTRMPAWLTKESFEKKE
jgi:hypothetical protein